MRAGVNNKPGFNRGLSKLNILALLVTCCAQIEYFLNFRSNHVKETSYYIFVAVNKRGDKLKDSQFSYNSKQL